MCFSLLIDVDGTCSNVEQLFSVRTRLHVRNTRVVLRRTFHDPYTYTGQTSRVPPSYTYIMIIIRVLRVFLTVNMTYVRSVHLSRSNDINYHLTRWYCKSSSKTGNTIISLRRSFRALELTTTGGHVSPRRAHKILCADVTVYRAYVPNVFLDVENTRIRTWVQWKLFFWKSTLDFAIFLGGNTIPYTA